MIYIHGSEPHEDGEQQDKVPGVEELTQCDAMFCKLQ